MRSATVPLLAALLALAGCAANSSATDSRSARDCPSGQVLVCKGSSANSRVEDSRLNEKDICICQQVDPM